MTPATALHRRPRAGWLAALLLALALPAVATEQIPDVIALDGQQRPLHSEPLGTLLQTPAHWQHFQKAAGRHLGGCSANWRGYRAWWALRDARLWLERMVYGACDHHARDADLTRYFPRQTAPIFADWYSGTLVVPLGEEGKNQHMGYSAQYPRYRLVEILAGQVISQREIDHEHLLQWHRQQHAATP